MRTTLRRLFTLILCLLPVGMAAACTPPASPTPSSDREFTVHVTMNLSQITQLGGAPAVKAKVQTQLAAINSRFASFDPPIKFTLKDFVPYSDAAASEQAGLPHPNADFLLAYLAPNAAENDVQSGWYGSNYAITLAGDIPNGGSFGSHGTDALSHEFGHGRCAVDMYGLNVDGSKNPVNGQSYVADSGIMTYPYGVLTWDSYSRQTIAACGTTLPSGSVVASHLPGVYRVQVNGTSGTPLAGATVRVYPVTWFSGSVSATPVQTGTTNAQGSWTMTGNPFQPGSTGFPWDVVAANFLVHVTKGSFTTSVWLSLSDAGLHYYANSTAPYVATLALPIG